MARKTRRADGRPETEADKRFFDLRESGYRGPIDRDGRIPDGRRPETRMALDVLAGLAGDPDGPGRAVRAGVQQADIGRERAAGAGRSTHRGWPR